MGTRLRRAFVTVTAGTLAVAAADACSSDTNPCVVSSCNPPATRSFVGPGREVIDFGAVCNGLVYYPDGSGWAYCVGGVWDYTVTDPSTDGYTLYAGGSDGGDGGSSGDSSSGETAPSSSGDGSSSGETGTSSGDGSHGGG